MRRLYSLLMQTIVWVFLVPWKILGQVRGQVSREELRQCLGHGGPPPGTGGARRVVVHAVSVGEMAAVGPLLRELESWDEPPEVLLTAGNRDGVAAGRRLAERYRGVAAVEHLPWDRAGTMRTWLGRTAPALLVVVENELWPNLYFASRDAGIPLCLVNGRIYPRDVARYSRARSLFRDVLGCADWIGVQNEAERARFLALGAASDRVEVAGNLKFDVTEAAGVDADPRFATLERAAPLVVAGSTHAPEEEWLLDALGVVRADQSECRLLLAPRRFERGAAVAALARGRGLRTVRWSELRHDEGDWDVLVLDELGRLAAAYRFADVCVVGGSFAERGGQNPLEPAAAGRPIVIGPHVEHFREVVEGLAAERALVQLAGRDELGDALGRLLSDAEARTELGRRARAAAESGRGVAPRYAGELLRLLAAGGRVAPTSAR